jgi:hypothetical protein
VPESSRLSASKEALLIGIVDHLKSKSTNPTVIQIEHDVFRYLFPDHCVSNKSLELFKHDFAKCDFSCNWYKLFDRIGDGDMVEFPVRIRLFLSKSPKNHTLKGDKVVAVPRFHTEKASISFNKVACSLN